MLAQIEYGSRRGLLVEEGWIRGMAVLRICFDPEGFWAGHRLKQAGRVMSRWGIRRALAPEVFDGWGVLNGYGVCRVRTEGFLRAQTADISLAALKRAGKSPSQSAVALRGARADRYIVRAACQLCEQVRDVCVSIPKGGEELREYLRLEYGAAVRPDFMGVEAAVRFDSVAWDVGGVVLDLFDPRPELGMVKLHLEGEVCPLPVLAALWEAGKAGRGDIEIS